MEDKVTGAAIDFYIQFYFEFGLNIKSFAISRHAIVTKANANIKTS